MSPLKINLVLGLVLCASYVVGAEEPKNIYMRLARMQDQVGAASGYIYSLDSPDTASYSQFADTSINLADFGNAPTPPKLATPLQQASYFVNHLLQYPQPIQLKHNPNAVVLSNEDLLKGMELADKEALKYDSGAGKGNEDFSESEGEKYETSEHSAKGEKGESDYKQTHEFDKGSKGRHEKEEHKGLVTEKGGHKRGYHDSAQNYAAKEEAGKEYEGESFGKVSRSKNNSKTTGYHKVFHKDEYKKDHTFYDEADRKGHFKKYGDHEAHHSSEEGGHKKGGNSDAAYEEKNNGKDGHYDKGHYLQNDSGYNGAEGGNKYYQNYADYENKEGHQDRKSHGYSQGKEN